MRVGYAIQKWAQFCKIKMSFAVSRTSCRQVGVAIYYDDHPGSICCRNHSNYTYV